MRMNAAVLRSLGRLSLSILGVGCILSVSTAALAVPITYNFTGTVQVLTFGWGTATAGDVITGTFTFDDGLTDVIASDGAAKYSTAASTAGISGSLTAGGFTIMADSASDPTASFLQLFDDSPSDNFTFSVEEMNLSLNQLGGGTSLAGLLDGVNVDPISTAVTVLNGIDPADFAANLSTWIITPGSEQIRFSLNSITQVPEPSTASLLALGLVGLAAKRRRAN